MTTTIARKRKRSGNKPMARAEHGFSLLELVMAMAIFLIVSGMSFSLFNQQQASAKLLQGLTGLNVSLRNAATLLQVDLAGAGSGYFQQVNMPSWPVGVTLVNTMVANVNCNTGTVYSSTCFDQINIVVAATPAINCGPAQPCYPPIHVADCGAAGSGSNTSAGTACGQFATTIVNGVTTVWTLAQTAAAFSSGDQLLFLNNTGTQVTTVKLTANAAVSGTYVKFTFNATNADGSTTSSANDPLDIAWCDGLSNCASSFGGATSGLSASYLNNGWIIKLAPINYLVCAGPGSNATWCADTSSTSPDIQDPKLMRVQNGIANVVMEQVIGFRAGATLWNGGIVAGTGDETTDNDSVSANYDYLASTYCIGGVVTTTGCTGGTSAPYRFSLIRAVRVSLIGRTPPSNADSEFHNSFDNGRYQVQGIAVVVNPRNMSMNDN